MAHPTKLEREIAAIGDLPREELVDRWRKAYGRPPPKGIKRSLIERSAAWHLQARRLGGFPQETRRTLRRLLTAAGAGPSAGGKLTAESACSPDDGRHGSSSAIPSSLGGTSTKIRMRMKLAPGARLVREWNGRMHVVEVVEGGFVHDGKTWRSLSAIARRITGAHWSGPRFFGL